MRGRRSDTLKRNQVAYWLRTSTVSTRIRFKDATLSLKSAVSQVCRSEACEVRGAHTTKARGLSCCRSSRLSVLIMLNCGHFCRNVARKKLQKASNIFLKICGHCASCTKEEWAGKLDFVASVYPSVPAWSLRGAANTIAETRHAHIKRGKCELECGCLLLLPVCIQPKKRPATHLGRARMACWMRTYQVD